MPRPPRRFSRQRKPADPMLMGEPSPALTKIARMNTQKLTEHIQTMQTEADRLDTRIANLSNIDPPDEKKIAQLRSHLERLTALTEAAREHLAGKIQRRNQRSAGGYR
jgi:predicted  nucleic acid-binding Zn-ribbon protein